MLQLVHFHSRIITNFLARHTLRQQLLRSFSASCKPNQSNDISHRYNTFTLPIMDNSSQNSETLQQASDKILSRQEKGRTKDRLFFENRRNHLVQQRRELGELDNPKEKFHAAAKVAFEDQSKEFHEKQNYCVKCRLSMTKHICDKVKPIITKHQYIIWIHYREYWRSTNTGVLLPLSGNNSRMLIFGLKEDDAELDRICKEEADRTILLFICPSSRTIRDHYNSKTTDCIGIQNWDEFLAQLPPLNIIAVDATWNQARTMNRHLPDAIPRIHLENPPDFSVSTMRTQSSTGRVTTAEGMRIQDCYHAATGTLRLEFLICGHCWMYFLELSPFYKYYDFIALTFELTPIDLIPAVMYIMKELGEDKDSVDNLLYNLQIRCDAVASSSGSSVNKAHFNSLANREERKRKNYSKKEIDVASAESSDSEPQL